MTKSQRILAIALGAAMLISGFAFVRTAETLKATAEGVVAISAPPLSPLFSSKTGIAGLIGFKTGYADGYDAGLRQVLFKPVERSSLIRFAFALLRTRLAGSALLGVAMLLGLAITVFGLSVYIKGDLADTLADNKPYRVYDNTINLNGEIDHPWQTRNAAFWLIFESVKNKNGCADGHYLLALRDSWNASSPDYVDFSKDKNFTTLNDASYRLRGIYTYVYRECPSWGDGGITWLEWGWTSYWLNNPNYNLKVGPAGSLVQRSGDMTKDFPGAPQKVSWVKGNTYTVRLVGSLESGFGQQDSTQHDDRQIIYKGLPDVNDTSDLDNQVGNTLTIKLAPADPDDYSLVNCKSTIKNYKSTYIAPDGSKGGPKDTVVLTGGPEQGGRYLASLTLDSKGYHKGETFYILTECDIQPKPGGLCI